MAYAEPDPVPEGALEHHDLNPSLTTSDRKSRQEAAIGLKISGANYSEIADVLGYSSAAKAREAVERGLAAIAVTEDRERLRFLEARRLERLLRSLWGKATDPHHGEQLAAARTALAVIDRHSRLFNVTAPTEMVVYNPTATEMESWIEKMAKQVREAGPQEVDIIEGEIIAESGYGDGDPA